MAARFVDERRFDAPVAALYALLTDPRAQEARSRHLGSQAARCSAVDRTVTLDEVRDTGFRTARFESRFVTRWSEEGDERRGAWELAQTAGPGEAAGSGTIVIAPDGPARCRLVVEGTITIRVGVALLERTIERLAVRRLRAQLAEEARFWAGALARRDPA